MSSNNNDTSSVVMAFVAGAALGAVAALLLTPASGREVRGKLVALGETSAEEMKRLAREAKFRMSPKTKAPDYKYDGGDAWI